MIKVIHKLNISTYVRFCVGGVVFRRSSVCQKPEVCLKTNIFEPAPTPHSFFFLFWLLIGWQGLFPGILVTQQTADVTALLNEVWVCITAFVNKQAGKFRA